MTDFFNFCERRVGRPYDFRVNDCETLVIDGLKTLYKIEVSELSLDKFVACDRSESLFFACKDKDSKFCHCGLYSGGYYLHAVGNPNTGNMGQVLLHNESQFNRFTVATGHNVEYFKCR